MAHDSNINAFPISPLQYVSMSYGIFPLSLFSVQNSNQIVRSPAPGIFPFLRLCELLLAITVYHTYTKEIALVGLCG